MTKKIWILMLVLSLLLTGCAAANVERTLDAAEEKVEEKLEAAEDRVEDALRAAPEAARPPETTAATVPAQTEPVQAPSAVPAQPDARISNQEAERIALDHAGLTAGDVSRLRSEFDWDDGVPQYDVEFRKGREEYEFEIHAESGKILSWDKDFDD